MRKFTVTPRLAADTKACCIGWLSSCSSSAQIVVPERAESIRSTSGVCAPGDQTRSEPLGTTPEVGGLLVACQSLSNVAPIPATVAGLLVITAKSLTTG